MEIFRGNVNKFSNAILNSKNILDSIAVILDPCTPDGGIYYQSKNFTSASIIGISNNGSYQTDAKNFSRRQNMSQIIVPLAGDNIVIDSVILNWKRDYSISYLATTNIFYDGYSENELPLIQAIRSKDEDITASLLDKDEKYGEMDSTTEIILKFYCDTTKIQEGLIRDYVIVVDGRYENKNPESEKIISSLTNTNNLIPSSYDLFQNYPNPFNSSTVIKYSLPKSGNVEIKLYDVLGKEIISLINEYKQAGYYSINFNASTLPSGIYFYRIKAGDFINTKKLILIK